MALNGPFPNHLPPPPSPQNENPNDHQTQQQSLCFILSRITINLFTQSPPGNLNIASSFWDLLTSIDGNEGIRCRVARTAADEKSVVGEHSASAEAASGER